MTIIGSASIQIRADDKYFEPDVKRAVAKIKNLSIQLRVDADTSAASKKIRDLRYRLTQKDAEIKIRANDAKFEDDVRKAVNKIRNVQIDLKADVDVAKASKKIRDLRYRITSNVAVLKIDADTTRAEEKMRKFLEKFTENKKLEFTAVAHTGAANTALEDLRQRYAANRVPFTAEANTMAANAALAFTARRRRAQIFAHVDPRAIAAAKGMFNTITGTISFDKIKNVLFGIMANFEGIATKATVAITAVGALGASVITLGANILSIAGDISQVISISAMLPAAFIAMGAIIASNKMAWKGFGEALSSDAEKAAEAIAKLEPAAQSAALAMRGTGAEIKKATQVSFWSNMNGVVEYAVDRLLPELVSGFGAVGSAMGQLQNTGITALADTFGGGVLEGILGNVAGMLSNASTGVAKFISAFGTLATVGSTYLPALGQSLTNAATDFDNFIKHAQETGKINEWIEVSVQRFQELGQAAGASLGIMSGLTAIARESGAPGLTDMANGLTRIANTVNSEPFTSQLLAIFTGAREGTASLGAGLRTLSDLFWESAESVGAFLALAGEIGGLAFENITALFDGTGLGGGLYSALTGLKDAMSILEPGFRNIGIAVGELGPVVGTLLTSMAPGLNMLADTIRRVVSGLSDGMISAMVPLNQFIQALANLASGPIVLFANIIGNLLEFFGSLPGVVQVAIGVFVTFIALQSRFVAFFTTIQVAGLKAWTTMTTTAATSTSRVQALLAAQAVAAEGSSARQIAAAQRASATLTALAARTAAAQAASAAGAAAAQGASAAAGAAAQTAAAGTAATGVATASRTMADHGTRIAGAWRGVGSTFQNAGGGLHGLAGGAVAAGRAIGVSASSGLQMAGKGLMSMLGGPWGAALAVAGVALAMFSANNAKAKAEVEAFTTTLDKQTGAFTEASRKSMVEGILDLDQGKVEEFGHKMNRAGESATEILGKMGLSADDVTDRLMDTDGADAYISSWREISSQLSTGANVSEELANSVGTTAEALNGMNSNEVAKVAADIRTTGETALEASEKTKELAEATGLNSIQAQRLSDNYTTLASTTTSVSEKFSALKENIELLNGGQRSAIDGQKNYHAAIDSTKSALDEINSREGVHLNKLVDTAGAFDVTSQAGRDMYDALSVQSDAILQQAVSAFDIARKGGKSVEEAQAIAMQAMAAPLQSFRDSLSALGFAPAQIDGIVKQLGLVPETVETALMADGEQAKMEAFRTQMAMEAYASGNYEAVLAALPQQAKDALTETLGLTDEFKNGEYKAVLKALDDTPGGRLAALAGLATYEGTEWEAFLKANNMVPEEVAKANEAASKLTKEKNIDVLATDLTNGLLEEMNSYDIEGKKIALTAEDSVTDILTQVNASKVSDKQLRLTAEDMVSQTIRDLNNSQLDGKLTKLQAEDLASQVMDELNAKTVDGKHATITAEDLASTVLAHIGDYKIADKVVTATDGTGPAVQSALAGLTGIPSVLRQIDGQDLTGTAVATATTGMANVPSVWRQINGQDMTSNAIAGATIGLAGVPSVWRQIHGQDWTGSAIAGATTGLTGVPSVWRQINGQDWTGTAVSGATSGLVGVPSVWRSINANDFASAVASGASVSIESVDGTTVSITGHDYASGPAQNAISWIDQVRGKTVDIVTNFISRHFGENANGGLYTGDGVRQFADGGILDGAKGAAVKSFAGGGIENHTAQIARGAWPVRIWAEPETGGEAYIPLSKSKRKRSLDILKVVMSEFGLGHLTQQFADGGIMPATQTPSVVSSRYSVSSGNPGFASALQSNTTPIVVQVNPSASLDEEQVGKAAASQLYWQIMSTQK